jgi:hypothetical protein
MEDKTILMIAAVLLMLAAILLKVNYLFLAALLVFGLSTVITSKPTYHKTKHTGW